MHLGGVSEWARGNYKLHLWIAVLLLKNVYLSHTLPSCGDERVSGPRLRDNPSTGNLMVSWYQER